MIVHADSGLPLKFQPRFPSGPIFQGVSALTRGHQSVVFHSAALHPRDVEHMISSRP
jgi:hypothetical protein